MTRFFIEGRQVSQQAAVARFQAYNDGQDEDEVVSMWAQCLASEAARDDYLPADLEIVQA